MDFYKKHQELFNSIRSHLSSRDRVYLVGGVVRDILLETVPNDIDLVIVEAPRKIAQQIANDFSGDFYPLDEERRTYRVILHSDGEAYLVLDIAGMRGKDIQEDLFERDFTINAIAMDISEAEEITWIDPMAGREDLKRKIIRACSDKSLENDPVRVLRAIRFANQFNYTIEENTQKWMQAVVSEIGNTSAERIRDELFKALGKEYSARCLEMYPRFRLGETLFPAMVSQRDCWKTGCDWIQSLNHCDYGVLRSSQVREYQPELQAYLKKEITADRSVLALLDLSILLQCEWSQGNGEGDQALPEKEPLSRFMKRRGEQLVLSNHEISFLKKCLTNWNAITELETKIGSLDNVEIYRFFKRLGESGLGSCLLALSTTDFNEEINLEPRQRIVKSLLNAFFNGHDSIIEPNVFLNGHDLINKFKLKPGPKFKNILNKLAEAQVAGKVHNRGEAFRFVEKLLIVH